MSHVAYPRHLSFAAAIMLAGGLTFGTGHIPDAKGGGSVDLSFTCHLQESAQQVQVSGTVSARGPSASASELPAHCGFRLQLQQKTRGRWANLGNEVVPTMTGNGFDATFPVCVSGFSSEARLGRVVAEYDLLVSGSDCADPNARVRTVTAWCEDSSTDSGNQSYVELPPGVCDAV